MRKVLFRVYIILTVLACCISGCSNKTRSTTDDAPYTEYAVHYAKGFEVKKYETYTKVIVRNPWDTAQVLQQYILVGKDKELPANLPSGTVVRTPLDNVIAYSTIHCSTLKELGSISIVKGVCEPEYIKLDEIKKGIADKTIENLGLASGPDVEKILMLSPEAIFAAPIVGESYGNVVKSKIPIVETPDYTEPHPLGRAEWIRFYSLFVGKEQLADSLFAITTQNYNEIKDKVNADVKLPSVFTDTKYQTSWDMPGGVSYMANMLTDAGSAYIWKNDQTATFIPLSFEAVLDKAGEADTWIIKYFAPTDMTYQSLQKEYKPYSYFKAFKQRNVWGCNTSHTDYYEDLPIHPDYILQDLAAIFHPHLFPEYTPKYYKKLEE